MRLFRRFSRICWALRFDLYQFRGSSQLLPNTLAVIGSSLPLSTPVFICVSLPGKGLSPVSRASLL